MYSTNPYKDVPSQTVTKEAELLTKTMYDTPAMLSCLLHLSSSPNPSIADKARVAYQALLEVKDEAVTARAYANQRLIVDIEEMTK